MSDVTKHFGELHELLTRMLDGELSSEEHAAVERLLEGDVAAQGYYVDFVSTHALLRSELAPSGMAIALEPREAEASDAEGEEASGVGDRAVAGSIDGSRRRRFMSIGMRPSMALAAALALAGVAAIALWQGWWSPMDRGGAGATVANGAAVVATLVDGTDAQWADGSTVGEMTTSGAPVRTGVVSLRGGRAQVMFNSGALVTLSGPTDVVMTAGNRCELKRGTLVASVPKQARGFTVDTPGGQVVDLGTEFGVVVDDRGVVEVHVLKGVVETGIDQANGHRTPRTMRVGAAIRYGDGVTGKATTVPLDGEGFGRVPTSADATVRYAGSQLGLSAFRTSSTVKSRDPDGDAVYGTDGLLLFGVTPGDGGGDVAPHWAHTEPLLKDAVVSLPRYIASVQGAANAVHVRGATFLSIDDPNAKPGEGAMVHSGAIGVDKFTKVGQELAMFSLVIGDDAPAQGFRVGVLSNNQPVDPDDREYVNNLPATLRVAINGREAAGMNSGRIPVARDAHGMGRGDWYFFDVVGARAGDVLTVYVTNHADSGVRVRNKNNPYAGQLLGGVVFDRLAEP
ncbi:MAG: hypothetical protein GC159_06055 [Phycisphaera sp.]|nr:hypothetical protein [Phycisphaera sp.]